MKSELKLSWLITIVGLFLIVSGIVLGLIGAEVLNIPFVRMDLVPFAVGFCGSLLFMLGIIVILEEKYKTKEQQVEENDERNIAITQKAKSKAFDLMIILFSVGLLTLALLGYMNEVSLFSLIGLYMIGMVYYGYQLRINKKVM